MEFKNIVAAIDLEDDLAEGVVKAAYSLAQKDAADLKVICVYPPIATTVPGVAAETGAGTALASQALVDNHRAGRDRVTSNLGDLVGRLAPSARAVVLDGDPADAVAHHAQEAGADLIITGSHQRGFLGSLVKGSASRELVREAPCAVLLITKKSAAGF